MSGNLHHLLYISLVRTVLAEVEMESILAGARSYNAPRGITGGLFRLDDMLLQILEGPEGEVRELFGRIDRDPRHHKVRCLLDRPCKSRDFPNWSMNYGQFRETPQTSSLFRLCRGALNARLPEKGSLAILALIRGTLKDSRAA